jgi:hypothetical protein
MALLRSYGFRCLRAEELPGDQVPDVEELLP